MAEIKRNLILSEDEANTLAKLVCRETQKICDIVREGEYSEEQEKIFKLWDAFEAAGYYC